MLSTLVAAAATISAASAFAATGSVSEYSEAYQRGAHSADSENPWHFYATDFSSFFGSSDLVLSSDGTASGNAVVVGSTNTYGNIYFSGNGEETDAVTITGANIDSSAETKNAYGNVNTYYAFVVEGSTVTFSGSGVDIEELGLNLCIGTMSDATLAITGGAKVKTSAYYSILGSNGATGTISVSGEGSELHLEQITLGLTTSSLAVFVSSFSEEGYYDTRYLQSDDDYKSKSTPDETGKVPIYSQGVISVSDGGTVYIGADETSANSSQTKLQLANGVVSVDGSGSALYLGSGSILDLGGEATILDDDGNARAVYGYSQTIEVSNGGVFTNEKIDETQTSLQGVEIGRIYCASDSESTITVSGTGSSFDLLVGNNGAVFGENPGCFEYTTTVAVSGGTSIVSVTASNGGTFNVVSTGGIFVAQEEAALDTTKGYGSSDGFEVTFLASDGGTLKLISNGAETVFGMGAPETGYSSDVSVVASGEGSSVSIAGSNVVANYYDDSNVTVSFVVTDGATMSIEATNDIKLNSGSTIVVDSGSTLTTSGNVTLSGSDISLQVGGNWDAGSGTLTIGDDTMLAVIVSVDSADAVATVATTALDDSDSSAAISAGSVVISDSAGIYIVVDVSALAGSDLEEGDEFSVDVFAATDSSITGTISDDNVEIMGDSQSNWKVSVSSSTSVVSVVISYIPEPSMFGLVAGLAALGLAATRRRRNGRKA